MKNKIEYTFRFIIVIVLVAFSATVGVAPLCYNNSVSLANLQKSGQFNVSVDQLPKGMDWSEFNLVRKIADKFSIDFRLILAIINQESQFDEQAVSSRGALGLMQIMPITHEELTDKLSIQYPQLPKSNLSAGIYYFSKLRELFSGATALDKVCMALAAYNAGPSRIYDAQELAAYMGENPNSWSAIENVLPLLSKRYYSLHQSVWEDGKPRSGYFGSWRQTLAYVDNVMKTYRNYEEIFQ
jgi:soluble lytic murein transglycosylase-like protein